jgi:ubiquitin carboxyl-terminal hydrolase 9/24
MSIGTPDLNHIKSKTLTSIPTQTTNNEELIDEILLDGHLNITKELLLFQNAEKKYLIGSNVSLPNSHQLINDLVEYFIFPASYLFKKYRDSLISASMTSGTEQSNSVNVNALNNFEKILSSKTLKPICSTPLTILSAYELLVSLCTGCLPNLKELSNLLFQLFYPTLLGTQSNLSKSSPMTDSSLLSGSSANAALNNQLTNDCTIAQNEWEYIPAIGQRPHNGFVGLKNAGATCYMNSVLQQLFMIKSIRNFILNVETPPLKQIVAGGGSDRTSKIDGVVDTNSSSLFDDLDENMSSLTLNKSGNENEKEVSTLSEEDQRREYNISVFRHMQMIFGHLAESKMQYYIPKGFWRQFRFGSGERVNLREQHDAVEFFNSIVDCIDESMKALSKEQICSKILGGTFADQKICKGCPHRYSREESFTLLSVDVKHSHRLSESLEQYVKGDLLEGPNAYHCEKCNKKIDAVKRTCIKKLPIILAIQLKRFAFFFSFFVV